MLVRENIQELDDLKSPEALTFLINKNKDIDITADSPPAEHGFRNTRGIPRRFGKTDAYEKLDDYEVESPQSIGKELISRWKRVSSWFGRHKLLIGCFFPIISVVLETIMLSIFLYYYNNLPMDDNTGHHIRISPLYSVWPFVSCIGSQKLALFQDLSLTIVSFSVVGVLLSFWLNRNVHPGWWLRRSSLTFSLGSSALYIWLLFASDNNRSHLHITLVALRIVCLFFAKVSSFFTWFGMRKAYPPLTKDRASTFSFYWKVCLMILAFPLAIAANVGVFSCYNEEQIRTKGTVCYKMIAASAASDWAYTAVNIIFWINLSYDLYHDEHYGKARKGLVAKAEASYAVVRWT